MRGALLNSHMNSKLNMPPINPHNQQLYHLIFDYLKPRVESSDDLGTLVGYSIIKGLLDFKAPRITNKSKKWRILKKIEKELKLSELNATYSGLQQTILDVNEKGTFQSLSDIVQDTNLKINELLSGQQVEKQKSVLLKNALLYLDSKRANYEEKLRIRGLNIIDNLNQRGPIPGRSNFIKDYETLEAHFVIEKPVYSWR
jgi:hypothetical protein